jgi:hypothetical protein
MKFTNSWEERQSVPDMADECMQKYFKKNNLIEGEDWIKLGPDPKLTPNMKKMWVALQIILIPDYVFVIRNKLYIAEVKGTLKFKQSDYIHLSEMYDKAKAYKDVRVGITYFSHPDAEPVWLSYTKITTQWNDERIPMKFYPELDLHGNKKPYKILLNN